MFDVRTVHGSAWLADPSHVLQALAKLAGFDRCFSGREVAEYRRQRLEEARLASSKAIRATKGKIGVIPIEGPIQQRMTSELMKLGGTSCEEVGYALDVLLNDESVDAIVFHVDSPGGSSYGISELSDRIYAARGRKKTYAVANSLMASAAYWLGTSAETVVVTPGGDVGSVGCYVIHADHSKALEAEGVRVEMVKSGKYKGEFNDFTPLSDESRSHLQESVDETHDKFLQALKRNRGVSLDHVREKFGQGRLLGAEKALDAGMVDRVMSFDQLMQKLVGDGPSGGKKASAEVLRLSQEHRKRKDDLAARAARLMPDTSRKV